MFSFLKNSNPAFRGASTISHFHQQHRQFQFPQHENKSAAIWCSCIYLVLSRWASSPSWPSPLWLPRPMTSMCLPPLFFPGQGFSNLCLPCWSHCGMLTILPQGHQRPRESGLVSSNFRLIQRPGIVTHYFQYIFINHKQVFKGEV